MPPSRLMGMHHSLPYTVAINESYGQFETNVGIDVGKWQKCITPAMNKAELVLPTCISKWQQHRTGHDI